MIDRILEDDQSLPKKQRHTGKRIYDRLRDEHGFPGSSGRGRGYWRWLPSRIEHRRPCLEHRFVGDSAELPGSAVPSLA